MCRFCIVTADRPDADGFYRCVRLSQACGGLRAVTGFVPDMDSDDFLRDGCVDMVFRSRHDLSVFLDGHFDSWRSQVVPFSSHVCAAFGY